MTVYYYGTSSNNYYNYMGSDRLYADGGSGNDTILGNTNNDTVSGGSGNDNIYGYSGNDYLLGGSGNDYISGGSGNDRIDGYATRGTEYDTLSGGSGSDHFILGGDWGVSYLGNGYATITDWDRADDYLDVRGNLSSYALRTGNWGGTSATDTGIYYGNDLIAVLQDTVGVSLTTHDFYLV